MRKICYRCSFEGTIEYFKSKTNICKLCISLYNKSYLKQYYTRNKSKLLKQQKQQYKLNPEKFKQRSKIYAQEHPEVLKKIAFKYRQSPQGKLVCNTKTRNYRARKRNSLGTHSAKEFQHLINKQQNKCYWCNKVFTSTPEADHIIPLSKGGSNYISNIVAACRSCNASKQNKLPNEFLNSSRFPNL